MTVFDYFVLGIIIGSGMLGLIRGFLKEVFSLLAFVLSFIGALWWGPRLTPILSEYIDQPVFSMGLSYLLVFIAILLIIGLINKAFAAVLEITGLGLADKGLGLIFGLARGVLIVLVLVIVAGYSNLPQEPWWQQAQFSQMAVNGARHVKYLLPESLAEFLPYDNSKQG